MQPNEEMETVKSVPATKKPRTRRSAPKAKSDIAESEDDISPEHVLHELAAIAFAVPDDPGGPTVKMADKLRALEMIYKHLGMADMAGNGEGVVIIDGE